MNSTPNLGGLKSRVAGVALPLLLLILLLASSTSVPTGHVGVLTLFGKVTGEVLSEGMHLINPFKSVQKLSIQTQSVKESANTPSNEGLMLALDTSLLFHLDRGKAAQVFQNVGENYGEKIVEPHSALGHSRLDLLAFGQRPVHQRARSGAAADSR